MKRRIWAIFLCLCLVVAMLPNEALAAGDEKGVEIETMESLEDEKMTEEPEEPTEDKTEEEIKEELTEETTEELTEETTEELTEETTEELNGEEQTEKSPEEITVTDEEVFDEALSAEAAFSNTEMNMDISTGNLTCSDNDKLYIISGSSNTNHITIMGGRESKPIQVELNGVNIDLHRDNDGDSIAAAPLTVKSGSYAIIYIGKENFQVSNYLYGGNEHSDGKNWGYAGLCIEDGAHVTIDGVGKLTVHGGGKEYGGAGIGGNYNRDLSDLVIQGYMVINATGAYGAPGIGAGRDGELNNLTIKNGNITAQGGKFAPGIGAGYAVGSGSGGDVHGINISGGTIQAKGGYHAAGIGGSEMGKVDGITISGGIVTASGGENGAGVGSSSGDCSNITISGGDVRATGGKNGAGIGSGQDAKMTNIVITNSIINATGGENAAGIGSGNHASTGDGGNLEGLTITGGSITATGGENGAGIGGGNGSSVSGININEKRTLVINATGKKNGAGIGSANSAAGDISITMKGATITAVGGENAAGIGGGNGDCGKITINGEAVIKSTGGARGAGIGGGMSGSASEIDIALNSNANRDYYVKATGGVGATGIGGGAQNGILHKLMISGGYVEAYAGGSDVCDIGHGGTVGEDILVNDIDFTVNGGTVVASKWSNEATLKINGGSISANLKNVKNNAGTSVYRTTLTLEKEANTRIDKIDIENSEYGFKDIFTDSNKKIYLYLPQSSEKASWSDVTVLGGKRHYYGTTTADGNGVLKMDGILNFIEPEDDIFAGKDFVMQLDDSTLAEKEYDFKVTGVVSLSQVQQATSPGAAVKLHANEFGDFTVSAEAKENTEDPIYWKLNGEYTGTVTKMQGTVEITGNPSKTYDGTPVEDPIVEKNGDGAVTYTYYEGSDTTGEALSGAPVNAGTYTVVAKVAPSEHYSQAISAPYTFTIEKREVSVALFAEGAGADLMVIATVLGAVDASGSIKFTVKKDRETVLSKESKISKAGEEYVTTVQFNRNVASDYNVTAEYIAGTPDNYICTNSPQQQTFEKEKGIRSVNVGEIGTKVYGDDAFNLDVSTDSRLFTDLYKYEVVYDEYPNQQDAVQVDADGKVTILNAGNAYIKVTLIDSTGRYYCDAVTYVKISVKRAPLHVTSYAEQNGVKVTSAQYGTFDGLTYGLEYRTSDLKNSDTVENFNSGYGTLAAVPLAEMLDVSDSPYEIGIVKEGADFSIGTENYHNVFISRNYELIFENGELEVTPAELIVKADDINGKWKTEPAYTYLISGLLPWDTEKTVFAELPQLGIDQTKTHGMGYAQLEPGEYPDSIAVTAYTQKKNNSRRVNYNVTTKTGNLQIDKIEASLSLEVMPKIYDGNPIEISTSAADDYDGIINVAYYKAKEDADGQMTKGDMLQEAPINAGIYYVEVSASETTHCKSEKTGEYIVISKAKPDPDIPVLSDVVMQKGLMLENQTLPAGWKWVEPEKELDVGTVKELAEYTPTDTENYEIVRCYLSFNVVEYVFTDGDDSVYKKGSEKTLKFTVNGPMEECTGIKIDGVLIDKSNYILESGSTIITLKNIYLETLSTGEHTIVAVYGNAEAEAKFKIATDEQKETTEASSDKTTEASSDKTTETSSDKTTEASSDKLAEDSTDKSAKSPNTGDSINMIPCIILLFAVCGEIGVVFIRRKKRSSDQ